MHFRRLLAALVPTRYRSAHAPALAVLAVAIATLGPATVAGSDDVRAPAAGSRASALDPLAGTPRCFGAGARARGSDCRDDRLRGMVMPSPRRARALPNSPCA